MIQALLVSTSIAVAHMDVASLSFHVDFRYETDVRTAAFDLPHATTSSCWVGQVTVLFQPDPQPVQGEIAPALTFSNSEIALFGGQFELLPAEALEAAPTIDGDLAHRNGV